MNATSAALPIVGTPAQTLLIGAPELADMLGCSETHVWRGLHAAGKLPKPVKVGRLTRWRRAEILAWVEAGCPARSQWYWKGGSQ